eukprot:CAMPEP_0206467988 /NCGR_PEP_ID=MMETSP0324_2-20121206/29356_1 /ASSEMBLY_ACC=CAM_ASM_000836 /TAXON_ID=2866 /ORGANISM="Crypthecodinium cohnii, Strain Seligo" /LENGTH=373 /DNA_ID=CAMNT_0053941349 /DNA_START=162 /DNA_END=1283 /DNA_ORIENTATION=+
MTSVRVVFISGSDITLDVPIGCCAADLKSLLSQKFNIFFELIRLVQGATILADPTILAACDVDQCNDEIVVQVVFLSPVVVTTEEALRAAVECGEEAIEIPPGVVINVTQCEADISEDEGEPDAEDEDVAPKPVKIWKDTIIIGGEGSAILQEMRAPVGLASHTLFETANSGTTLRLKGLQLEGDVVATCQSCVIASRCCITGKWEATSGAELYVKHCRTLGCIETAIFVTDGACGCFESTAILHPGCHGATVVASAPGSKVTLENCFLAGIQGDSAIHAEGAAAISVSRTRILDCTAVGVFASDPGTSVSLKDVELVWGGEDFMAELNLDPGLCAMGQAKVNVEGGSIRRFRKISSCSDAGTVTFASPTPAL